MKFIHISDLHIGKRVNEYSMTEDQQYILKKIIKIACDEKPDGVIIAGDIYDKSVPPAEAVEIFDDFLVSLSKMNIKVFAISGNHDSAERIAFGSRLMHGSGIYMSPVYSGKVFPVTLEDEYGKINIYMLPFIKPVHVKRFFEDKEISSYTDALRIVIDDMKINTAERNILITHQFVTGASKTESEDISVGGTDNVDAEAFKCFDYTALGHLHRAQSCQLDKIRYSGTPLKYSFSEAGDKKTVTVIELRQKGEIKIKETELVPLRDMHEIKGKYEEVMRRDFYENTSYPTDYVHITLTDEEDIYDAASKLRTVYKGLMRLDYDNARTRNSADFHELLDCENKSPFELFSEFYENQNGKPMTEEQASFMTVLIESIGEGEK